MIPRLFLKLRLPSVEARERNLSSGEVWLLVGLVGSGDSIAKAKVYLNNRIIALFVLRHDLT